MKRFLGAFISVWAFFFFAATVLAGTSAILPNAKSKSATGAAKKVTDSKRITKDNVKQKPFTPEDLAKAKANQKKLEWWQMPKPPVFQSHGSRGGGHGGH